MSVLVHWDPYSGDMDSGDLSLRVLVPWDLYSGDTGSGDLTLRDSWDPCSGDMGSESSRDFPQGPLASHSSFGFKFTATPVLGCPLSGLSGH